MGSRQHDEVERKFDVDSETIFPTLGDVDGVSSVSQPTELELVAVYFDTAGLDLARNGMTLRRRTGGDDAGWHLKVPRARDIRTEHRQPLGRATKSVPQGLLPPVRAIVRDRRLAPVARVKHSPPGVHARSMRTPLLWPRSAMTRSKPSGSTVRATYWAGASGRSELVDGEQGVLEAIEARLLDVGAMKASAGSKLGRVLGDAVPAAPRKVSRKRLAARQRRSAGAGPLRRARRPVAGTGRTSPNRAARLDPQAAHRGPAVEDSAQDVQAPARTRLRRHPG